MTGRTCFDTCHMKLNWLICSLWEYIFLRQFMMWNRHVSTRCQFVLRLRCYYAVLELGSVSICQAMEIDFSWEQIVEQLNAHIQRFSNRTGKVWSVTIYMFMFPEQFVKNWYNNWCTEITIIRHIFFNVLQNDTAVRYI